MAEAQEGISSLNPKKSSGYVPIAGEILKELPIIGIKYLPSYNTMCCSKGTCRHNESRTDHPHFEARVAF
jgi:hypothetical protein